MITSVGTMPHPNLSGLREGGAPPPPELPRDLWFAILAVVETEDPCEEVEKLKLCDVKREWARWCRDGSLYDAANQRLGWYGPYRTWAEVLQFYTSKGEPWATTGRNSTPKAYFQQVCRERREIVDLLLMVENVQYDIDVIDQTRIGVNNTFTRRQWEEEAGGRARPEEDVRILIAYNGVLSRLEGTIERITLHPYAEYLLKFAVQIDGRLLRYVPGSMRSTIKPLQDPNPNSLGVVPPTIRNYNEIAKAALQQNGGALEFVNWHRPDYGELARIAVVQGEPGNRTNQALAFVPGSAYLRNYQVLMDPREDFTEIAKLAVRHSEAILWAVRGDPHYDEIAAAARPRLPPPERQQQEWWERRRGLAQKTFPDWAPPTKYARHTQEAARITELVNTMPMAASAAL